MRSIIRYSLIAALFFLAAGGAAQDLKTGPGSAGETAQSYLDEGGLTTDYLTDKVTAAGFTDIYYIGYEHGLYDIKARHPNGQYVKILIDPKTGELVRDAESGKIRFTPVTRPSVDDAPLAWDDIIRAIRKEGYLEVYSIHYDHYLYEVTARDRLNQVFELYVNPNTGQLLRHPVTGKPLTERVDQ